MRDRDVGMLHLRMGLFYVHLQASENTLKSSGLLVGWVVKQGRPMSGSEGTNTSIADVHRSPLSFEIVEPEKPIEPKGGGSR